ncbi:unnamed protein product [Mesocestoides corti]|nr:unnamed protein product [Mesocestoides corti]
MKPSKDNAYPWSICRSLTWYCRNRRINTSLSLFQFSRESGTYLTFLYFFVKFLYVVNAVGQIYLMECFVGSKVTFYGAAVLADLIAGRDWQQSGHFPRVTFCDMEAKKLGKNHVYTIQCVLPINMFLEKIYIFLWFWHIMLTIVTLTSLIGWIKCLFWRRGRLKFVRRYLKAVGFLPRMLDPRDRQRTRQFVEEYLTADAFFLIRLIGTNNGDLLASELTSELWSCFLYRAAGPKSPALPPQVARLCPKHAVCTCQICVGGRVNIASVTAAVSGVPKPEASIFEMKNYPEKSPASQQPGCGCEGNRSGEAKEMPSRNKSSAGGDSNTPEDIV